MIQKKGNDFYQWFYSHFAIYIGNGEIVHLQSPSSSPRRGIDTKCAVTREKMVDAFRNDLVRKNNHLDNMESFRRLIRSPREIVKTAREIVKTAREIVKTAREWLIKYWDYNFFTNNCEHFATVCRYGRPVSLQSFGIGDLATGKISYKEYWGHSVYSIKEKVSTLTSWASRKLRGVFDGIRG